MFPGKGNHNSDYEYGKWQAAIVRKASGLSLCGKGYGYIYGRRHPTTKGVGRGYITRLCFLS